jgi:hypothetical protein
VKAGRGGGDTSEVRWIGIGDLGRVWECAVHGSEGKLK